MSREDARLLLPIIQAYAEGKVIQGKINDYRWTDLINSDFSLEPNLYRIKPEPREYWICGHCSRAYVLLDHVKSHLHDLIEAEIIHVREVL